MRTGGYRVSGGGARRSAGIPRPKLLASRVDLGEPFPRDFNYTARFTEEFKG